MDPVRTVVTLALVCLVGLSAAGPGLAGASSADRPGGAVEQFGSPSSVPPGTADAGHAVASQEGRPGDAPGPGFLQTTVDPDAVVMRAGIDADGTAGWRVEYRLRLDDDNATAAFESLREDVEANATAFTGRFADGMRRTVWSAENATAREMALANVTVAANRQTFGQEYGVVTYRFRWTNFATTDGDRLRAGDALAELFLDSETTLVLAYPGDYAVETVQPRPSENRTDAVVWRGPIDFGPEEPGLVVAPDGGSSSSLLPIVGGIGLLLALAAGGWLLRRRGSAAGRPGEPAAAAGGGSDRTDATATAGEAEAPDGTGADDGETASGGDEATAAAVADSDETAAAAADSDETADGDGSGTSGPPEELLSNEERVLKLLDESGGRIKQQRIVEDLDWTAAKTSQVVGNLRDEDAVETFRIGRENVVTLPEESDLLDGE
jgi:hypothetical protein